ncbi:hypothetical protein ACFWJY_01995 [Streptomyces anulatus]|uniref:hypothetical protein n=1 Tax=Streptomyces anulatus TaxID=1892 RepID=UPI003652B021
MRSGGGDEPHELLKPLEIAASLVVERDDLSVQHGGAPAEDIGEGKELRYPPAMSVPERARTRIVPSPGR